MCVGCSSCLRPIGLTCSPLPRRSLICRALQLPSDGSAKADSKDAMLLRIKRAREYKQARPAQPATTPEAAATPVSLPADDPALHQFAQYAQEQADAEAERLLEAQMAAAEQFLNPSPPARQPPPAARPALPAPTSLGQRLRRAQAYKDQLTPAAPPMGPASAPPSGQQQPPPPPRQPGSESTQPGTSNDDPDRGFRSGGGDAERAANWLNTVSSQGRAAQLDKSLSPEQFTLQLEQLQRQNEVTFQRATGKVEGTRRRRYAADDYGLSQQHEEMAAGRAAAASERAAPGADAEGGGAEAAGAAAPQEGSGGVHKPAVATWGVYPRPKNISEAYGGGRNLKPGQRLEPEEVSAARAERVSSALSSYRKSLGLDIDPQVEAAAQALFEEGEALFKAGALAAALARFQSAGELVPLRSRLGGLAGLQAAICLDSLGRNEEAYRLYCSLKGHSAPGVAKAVKRMLFGFQAAKDLKVDTMQFGTTSKSWQPWFDRINSDGWAVYSAKEGEDGDEAPTRTAAAVAAAVVLLPLGLMGVLVLAN